ncbi:MAG: hypothetical protein IGS50_20500 [Synechococcales cyanobacterium C42_A2020_086]|jgi:hypothetical protein|nr:hypothetical protein [Synechococcales cyanobacterium C42_A2020_086]
MTNDIATESPNLATASGRVGWFGKSTAAARAGAIRRSLIEGGCLRAGSDAEIRGVRYYP